MFSKEYLVEKTYTTTRNKSVMTFLKLCEEILQILHRLLMYQCNIIYSTSVDTPNRYKRTKKIKISNFGMTLNRCNRC